MVAHIFELSIAGKGPDQIARQLEKDQVLTTRAYYAKRKGKPLQDKPCHWNNNSIVGILERMEYTGCTCNFKTYSIIQGRSPHDVHCSKKYDDQSPMR